VTATVTVTVTVTAIDCDCDCDSPLAAALQPKHPRLASPCSPELRTAHDTACGTTNAALEVHRGYTRGTPRCTVGRPQANLGSDPLPAYLEQNGDGLHSAHVQVPHQGSEETHAFLQRKEKKETAQHDAWARGPQAHSADEVRWRLGVGVRVGAGWEEGGYREVRQRE